MVLSDRTIKEEVAAGRLVFDPYDETLVQPSSVDVRVDRSFRVFNNSRYPYIDVREPMENLVARLEGKSSLGRLGLVIHSTAGFVDPGFEGNLTLELSNLANLPITIYHGMPIGQISFMRMDAPVEHAYGAREAGSKYQGQAEPTASRFYLNFRERVQK
jgi:dCTP deaminase